MVARSRLLLLLLAIVLAVCTVHCQDGGAAVSDAIADESDGFGEASVDVDPEEAAAASSSDDDADSAAAEADDASPAPEADEEEAQETEADVLEPVHAIENKVQEVVGGAKDAVADVAGKPSSDWQCKFSWASKRCEPRAYCEYKYQFLDATPSESCRRKGVLKAKHALHSGALVSPAAAVGGATALFAADLAVIATTPALKKAPLLTNVVQGFALFLSGDTYFQVIEQGWASKIGYSLARAAKAGVIGALNNGLVHFTYYKWIDRHFPYHKFTVDRWGPKDGTKYKLIVAWTKYWLEWPTIGVYKIASSFALTALMNNDLKALPEKFSKRFMLTWLRSLQVWPLYDTFAYAYIPTDHRPLFNTFMSIAWGGYLSHISQPEAKVEETEEAAAAVPARDEL
ncbi:protein required for ethanol metabolism [Tribonema minus]|uniref:Protein required for ethanol metabolism n=1 Tax=Tribonema minus TaxID=303371 RepID=A0A836CEJ0_9STRA|nr:protein required for ethanol metabolism [Tribonema minus]